MNFYFYYNTDYQTLDDFSFDDMENFITFIPFKELKNGIKIIELNSGEANGVKYFDESSMPDETYYQNFCKVSKVPLKYKKEVIKSLFM